MANDQQNIVNVHKDFKCSMHSNFFQGQMVRGPFYGQPFWKEEVKWPWQVEGK
jgi:hypothetical protein